MSIRIVDQMGLHEGGTKYYRVMTAYADDGTAFVVFQFGPNGKLGSVSGVGFGSQRAAEIAANEKVVSKARRGYDFRTERLLPGSAASDSVIDYVRRNFPAFDAWVASKSPGAAPPWNPTPPASVAAAAKPEPKPEPKREDTDPHWGTW